MNKPEAHKTRETRLNFSPSTSVLSIIYITNIWIWYQYSIDANLYGLSGHYSWLLIPDIYQTTKRVRHLLEYMSTFHFQHSSSRPTCPDTAECFKTVTTVTTAHDMTCFSTILQPVNPEHLSLYICWNHSNLIYIYIYIYLIVFSCFLLYIHVFLNRCGSGQKKHMIPNPFAQVFKSCLQTDFC